MSADQSRVEWPTLFIVPDWIEAHCPIPDGIRKGDPFVMTDWQLWCTANHYRVLPTAKRFGTQFVDEDGLDKIVTGASAFFYRRSQIVGSQKTGKGPHSASIVAGEGVGPVLFDGWATGGEMYRCADWGCGCGWEYVYRDGEPMGRPWPTPLIQLTATSQDQVDNVYTPLQEMIKLGPLIDLMRPTEDSIAISTEHVAGEIAPVTSSANSRLGNPVTFVLHDESGLYTVTNKLTNVADTQRRGLAGMGGRGMETTNAWDPSQRSTAQVTYESDSHDVFKFFDKPPAQWSYANKEERHKIHAYNYRGSPWVGTAEIDAEAAELWAKDPAQAERFFGNRLVVGSGAWMPPGLWEASFEDRVVPV